MNREPVHIICIQWGDAYGEKDINRLYNMLKFNTTFPINLHVFSNLNLPLLHKDINQHKEPLLSCHEEIKHLNYRKEVGLCDKQLGNLQGKRVFFFDLDIVITGNLDDLFSYPEEDDFYIIKDWNTKGSHVGQATCYSFVVGTLGYIRDTFEHNWQLYVEKFGTASQEYLSAKIIEKKGSLNFWPAHWFASFKYHCLPHVLLRHFLTPKPPNQHTKVLCFHGYPNIDDAIMGRWSSPTAKKPAKGWKKIYKSCRPTYWIKNYLRDDG